MPAKTEEESSLSGGASQSGFDNDQHNPDDQKGAKEIKVT